MKEIKNLYLVFENFYHSILFRIRIRLGKKFLTRPSPDPDPQHCSPKSTFCFTNFKRRLRGICACQECVCLQRQFFLVSFRLMETGTLRSPQVTIILFFTKSVQFFNFFLKKN